MESTLSELVQLIEDFRPLNTPYSSGFQIFTACGEAGHKTPCHTHLTKELKLCLEQGVKDKEEVQRLQIEGLGLTTDIWTN